jgi:hypothetical protein
MSKFKVGIAVVALCALLTSAGMAASVKMKLSGPGKVNDSTIKAGQKVALDIYLSNEKVHMGLSMGFKITSPDGTIKMVEHPVDSAKGAEGYNGIEGSKGDIKGSNGFESKALFDLINQVVPTDWDGKLPDVIGFLMHGFKKRWQPMQETKAFSIELVAPNAGTLVVDSSFFPPGGRWITTNENAAVVDVPTWGGPYKFKVVK